MQLTVMTTWWLSRLLFTCVWLSSVSQRDLPLSLSSGVLCRHPFACCHLMFGMWHSTVRIIRSGVFWFLLRFVPGGSGFTTFHTGVFPFFVYMFFGFPACSTLARTTDD